MREQQSGKEQMRCEKRQNWKVWGEALIGFVEGKIRQKLVLEIEKNEQNYFIKVNEFNKNIFKAE